MNLVMAFITTRLDFKATCTIGYSGIKMEHGRLWLEYGLCWHLLLFILQVMWAWTLYRKCGTIPAEGIVFKMFLQAVNKHV